jgi:hypothetical protein
MLNLKENYFMSLYSVLCAVAPERALCCGTRCTSMKVLIEDDVELSHVTMTVNQTTQGVLHTQLKDTCTVTRWN